MQLALYQGIFYLLVSAIFTVFRKTNLKIKGILFTIKRNKGNL